ncbi:hypothetical protein [uncultured Alistipes sp.]|uniref:hypothetical protein n=1 Tax=uncultured Alistipes sp. TaxID=538949 RepID=UPI0025EC9510|nr:hypothetical protein [uncultured Alistipes sp.]
MMKKLVLLAVAVSVYLCCPAQKRTKSGVEAEALMKTVAELTAKVDSLTAVIGSLNEKYVPVRKEIDPAWAKWRDVRYNYGFNTLEQPVFNTVDGILESTVMLSVRGGRGRWNSLSTTPESLFVDGGHLFEGWNASESCRLTMLIGRQAPDIACIQVYSPQGLYRPQRHFGWVKLGSDADEEGVDFGSHWAKSFVPFSLAALDQTPDSTVYENRQLGSTDVPVGTLYYDTTAGKVRCYTESGWKYLAFE